MPFVGDVASLSLSFLLACTPRRPFSPPDYDGGSRVSASPVVDGERERRKRLIQRLPEHG